MPEQIIIIGGGISGLSVLHGLNQRFAGDDAPRFLLLEKNLVPGGTMRSDHSDGLIFEHGPNGFLDAKPSTLKLVEELGMSSRLYPAAAAAARRFIKAGGRLHQLPTGPWSFLRFPLLNGGDKLRLGLEGVIRKGRNPDESVAAFGRRRLGKNAVRFLLDPMVSGIFAGDVERLHMASAFPRIVEMEQTYGSLMKALSRRRRERAQNQPGAPGQPAGRLCSFENGMGELVAALGERYAKQVHTNEPVQAVTREASGYIVTTSAAKYYAEQIIIATPAGMAANLLLPVSPRLAGYLDKIVYASVVVVGLAYRRLGMPRLPEGFGYLIPGCEGHKTLGVLNTSNIFPNRAPDEQFLFRVMIGGRRHGEIIHAGRENWINLARSEVEGMYGISEPPVQIRIAAWPQAIPQYELEYPGIAAGIQQELSRLPGLHLAANYLGGISLNDCTRNADLLVEKIVPR